jgi:site-specific recombinase XerD
MKTNFSLLFYMKKPKNYKAGDAPVYLRITVAGKRAEVTSGRKCEPSRWNAKAGRLTGTKEEAKSFNAYLDHLQAQVYAAHRDLVQAGEHITANSIKARLLGKEENTHTILQAIRDHNQRMAGLIGKEYVKATLSRFEVLERYIASFLKHCYAIADLNIKRIDHTFLNDLDFYLRTEKSCAHNTTIKHLKNFGKIIRICISRKWLDKDPMFGYKLRSKPVERPFLTEEELQRIAGKVFGTERLLKVRDIFLFCCFTGLAYADVEKLKMSDIGKGVDGNRWIFTNRKKTNTRSAIPLLPPAVALLDRYADNPYCLNMNKALPVSTNQKMNEYLREIAGLCGINKELSMHIARHTFATTVTLMNGVPIETVSKMLGHTNIRTTQIYAKVLDTKVGEDMAGLRSKFQEMVV